MRNQGSPSPGLTPWVAVSAPAQESPPPREVKSGPGDPTTPLPHLAADRLDSDDARDRGSESVQMGILLLDRDGTIQTANPLALRIFALTYDPLNRRYVSADLTTTLHEDGSQCADGMLPASRCLATGRPVEGMTLGVRRSNGEISWAVFSAMPLSEPDRATGSAPSGVVVTFFDITHRKAAEDLLISVNRGLFAQTGQAYFQSLVQHLGQALSAEAVCVAELHPEKRNILRVIALWQNGRIQENLEFELPGSACQTLLDRTEGLELDHARDTYPRDALLAGFRADGILGCALLDSFARPFGLIAALYRERVHNPQAAAGLMRVLVSRTAAELERRRAEMALRESENLLRSLVEHAPEALLLLDSATGEIVDTNDNALRLFGLPRAGMIHRPFFHLSPRIQVDGQPSEIVARAVLQEAVHDRDPVFEWLIRGADRRPIPCEVRLVRFPATGRSLVRGSFYDISKRKRAEAERDRFIVATGQARDQLRRMSRRLVEVQEEERRHLARELHDEVGQKLTALNLTLSRLAKNVEDLRPADFQETQQQVNDLLVCVRQMSLDLRPTMLDDLGLVPALIWLFDRLAASCRLRVTFKHSELENRRFLPEIETAIYRLIQEALTNVVRHANTTEANVRIWTTAQALHLQVEDAGQGFETHAAWQQGNSGGLSSMRERVALLHGDFLLESSPVRGTIITASLPLRQPPPQSSIALGL